MVCCFNNIPKMYGKIGFYGSSDLLKRTQKILEPKRRIHKQFVVIRANTSGEVAYKKSEPVGEFGEVLRTEIGKLCLWDGLVYDIEPVLKSFAEPTLFHCELRRAKAHDQLFLGNKGGEVFIWAVDFFDERVTSAVEGLFLTLSSLTPNVEETIIVFGARFSNCLVKTDQTNHVKLVKIVPSTPIDILTVFNPKVFEKREPNPLMKEFVRMKNLGVKTQPKKEVFVSKASKIILSIDKWIGDEKKRATPKTTKACLISSVKECVESLSEEQMPSSALKSNIDQIEIITSHFPASTNGYLRLVVLMRIGHEIFERIFKTKNSSLPPMHPTLIGMMLKCFGYHRKSANTPIAKRKESEVEVEEYSHPTHLMDYTGSNLPVGLRMLDCDEKAQKKREKMQRQMLRFDCERDEKQLVDDVSRPHLQKMVLDACVARWDEMENEQSWAFHEKERCHKLTVRAMAAAVRGDRMIALMETDFLYSDSLMSWRTNMESLLRYYGRDEESDASDSDSGDSVSYNDFEFLKTPLVTSSSCNPNAAANDIFIKEVEWAEIPTRLICTVAVGAKTFVFNYLLEEICHPRFLRKATNCSVFSKEVILDPPSLKSETGKKRKIDSTLKIKRKVEERNSDWYGNFLENNPILFFDENTKTVDRVLETGFKQLYFVLPKFEIFPTRVVMNILEDFPSKEIIFDFRNQPGPVDINNRLFEWHKQQKKKKVGTNPLIGISSHYPQLPLVELEVIERDDSKITENSEVPTGSKTTTLTPQKIQFQF